MHHEKMEATQHGGLDSGDFFSNAAPDAVPTFLLQRDMERIEFSSPDDVRLYRSINVAYVSPEGKGQEICEGFICCIRSGVTLCVYIALSGKESGRTRIYIPETQPADQKSYLATVAAAIAFGDQIGLVMELEKAETRQRRSALLRACPVLREVGA